jgi:2-polyprenyl-3-methyl-5-hydroxy-6-metoxy-1,4-benzoquinol methylase
MHFDGPANKLFKGLTDETWLDLLIRSVTEPVICSIEMPRFPHGFVQRETVGSADEPTLREAHRFYFYCKEWGAGLGRPLHAGSRLLDFGCGWGRFARVFWKEIAPEGIFGVDVSADLIATCKTLGVPGTFSKIEPRGRLPFDDQYFDLIIAYSVFTHLPEDVANHWMHELARTAKSGCVFALTVEPRRFLQFVADIPPDTRSTWHLSLSRFKSEIPELLKKYDNGRFCYIPTGGRNDLDPSICSDELDPSIYGDAAIPLDYIKTRWNNQFEVRAFIDDPSVFWQAFVILRRV